VHSGLLSRVRGEPGASVRAATPEVRRPTVSNIRDRARRVRGATGAGKVPAARQQRTGRTERIVKAGWPPGHGRFKALLLD